MEINGWAGGLYRICDWIMRLAYVNLLWILFSLLGLVLFGVMPATTALFGIIRKWVKGETDFPVFKEYKSRYVHEFRHSNLLGLILSVIGVLLYVELSFFFPFTNIVQLVLFLMALLMTFIFLTIMMYIFPLFVNYELNLLQYIKTSLLIGISYPIKTLGLLGAGIVLYFILFSIPGLLPFFSVSMFSTIILFSSFRIFEKIEQQKSVL